MKIGNGDFLYEPVESWGCIPAEWDVRVVAGVGIDREDKLYVLTRGTPAIIVMDKNGTIREHWGDNIFTRPHGMYIDENEAIYGVDDHAHVAFKFDMNKKLLMALGDRDMPSDTGYSLDHKVVEQAAGPFNRPTNVAIAKNKDIYITDGYGNCRVHCFAPDGTLKFSWGEPGAGNGQFNLPHGIVIDDEQKVYVADRQNNRIQIFDLEGNYLDEWTGFIRPADLCIGPDGNMYIAECKRCSTYTGAPSRVSIVNMQGDLLARLESEGFYDEALGHHTAHSICVDSEGSIYVGEVGKKIPTGYFGLKKYRRVKDSADKT